MLLRQHQNKQWGKVDHIVEMWLEERQEVLVKYYRLSKTSPFSEDLDIQKIINNDPALLTKFCQLLTDYVSAGHFEIFEKISMNSEKKPAFSRELMVSIFNTTNKILDFCERHIEGKNLDKLKSNLSFLGEQLAIRMELEDRLIEIYLQATNKSN